MDIHNITEQQNPLSMNIDEKSISDILTIINIEDSLVPNAVKNCLFDIEKFIKNVIPRLDKGGRLFYIGAGTSGRLGVLDAVECPPTYRSNPEMIQGIIAGGYDALISSIEGAEDSMHDGLDEVNNNNICSNDIVLGVAASSSTPFVLGAIKQAKSNGALTGLIACNKPHNIENLDHIISIIVGPEVITGSTRMKAGSATKLVLNMISTTIMIKMNKTYGNLMVDLNASNEKLWKRGIGIISHLTNLTSESAVNLLKSANGEVKTAILMYKKNYLYEEAKKKLIEHKGSLRQAICN